MYTHDAVAIAESSAASTPRQVTRYRNISQALKRSVEGASTTTIANAGAAQSRGHRMARTVTAQPETTTATTLKMSRTALLLGKGALEGSPLERWVLMLTTTISGESQPPMT